MLLCWWCAVHQLNLQLRGTFCLYFFRKVEFDPRHTDQYFVLPCESFFDFFIVSFERDSHIFRSSAAVSWSAVTKWWLHHCSSAPNLCPRNSYARRLVNNSLIVLNYQTYFLGQWSFVTDVVIVTCTSVVIYWHSFSAQTMPDFDFKILLLKSLFRNIQFFFLTLF